MHWTYIHILIHKYFLDKTLSVSGNVNYFMIISWISSRHWPFKQLIQTVMYSVVYCNLCYLTGRSQRSEGFQQCPAKHQTAGRDHHRLPETKAGGYQSQSDTYRETLYAYIHQQIKHQCCTTIALFFGRGFSQTSSQWRCYSMLKRWRSIHTLMTTWRQWTLKRIWRYNPCQWYSW